MDHCEPDAPPPRDWVAWHRQYEDPGSGLSWRLAVIQQHIRNALDDLAPGPIRVLSLCAGQGRDLIGALVDHPRRHDVAARLVELDPDNAEAARSAADAAGLRGIEILTADASTTSAFRDAVPAQLILACGIFGNITDADIHNTITHLRRLTGPRATVIWTRHRRPPDLTDQIRGWFSEAGFAEVALDRYPAGVQTVGVHRLVGDPDPYQAGVTMFRFLDYDQLGQSEGRIR